MARIQGETQVRRRLLGGKEYTLDLPINCPNKGYHLKFLLTNRRRLPDDHVQADPRRSSIVRIVAMSWRSWGRSDASFERMMSGNEATRN